MSRKKSLVCPNCLSRTLRIKFLHDERKVRCSCSRCKIEVKFNIIGSPKTYNAVWYLGELVDLINDGRIHTKISEGVVSTEYDALKMLESLLLFNKTLR